MDKYYHSTTPPQVLMLGNGVNRAYGGDSWSKVIESITTNPNINKGQELKCPMPLQAVLVTEDHVDQALKNQQDILSGKIVSNDHAKILQDILSTGFDEIITTNYSYELEMAVQPGYHLSEYKLRKVSESTTGKVEPKYLLHTYNLIDWNSTSNRVWHIHGEARKSDSMILGHYYYGNLLFRIQNYLKNRGNAYAHAQKDDRKIEANSWLDAFILGDVFILGLAYNISDFDLWWLLNRKKRENAETGKVYFFEPKESDGYDERLDLLRVMGVNLCNCEMTIQPNMTEEERSVFYQEFYRRAVADITSRVKR